LESQVRIRSQAFGPMMTGGLREKFPEKREKIRRVRSSRRDSHGRGPRPMKRVDHEGTEKDREKKWFLTLKKKKTEKTQRSFGEKKGKFLQKPRYGQRGKKKASLHLSPSAKKK